jgi:hypothetical protein
MADPGVMLVAKLIREFRASMFAQALPRTAQLLLHRLGPARARETLSALHRRRPPEMFPADEARAAAPWVLECHAHLPGLPLAIREDLDELERAAIRT